MTKKTNSLTHHGILGQKWGKKNGPPYPLGGGDYSKSEKKAIDYEREHKKNSIYNKKHFDEVLKEGTKLQTLSYDENRTEKADMFYASHDLFDNYQYKLAFNKKMEMDEVDENGNVIGSSKCYKKAIENRLISDTAIASEDTGAEHFLDLYKNDHDFANFVRDPDRMASYFSEDKYHHQGYAEVKDTMKKIQNPKHTPTEDEIRSVYRIFNYVIPYDGKGTTPANSMGRDRYRDDTRGAKDVKTQRAKFFEALKKDGYGGCLDTNDGLYAFGGFQARSPVIIFSPSNVVKDRVKNTSFADKIVGVHTMPLRKMLKR